MEKDMILPILSYGHPNLKKPSKEVEFGMPDLNQLIQDMFETMTATYGAGLAAPQIGRNLRIFVVGAGEYKKVFINPEILDTLGEEILFEEGCLSVPGIHELIPRKEKVHIRYLDENFVEHEEIFVDIMARVIQHEYDHLEGVLFTDKLSYLKKSLLRRKLNEISTGKLKPSYKMLYKK